jgi:hypothetical protein
LNFILLAQVEAVHHAQVAAQVAVAATQLVRMQ